ncbi:675_t:CDS:2 [Dentiscutata erythropus]|uniref:675_t:CDS:1 n=1 Tax=Dentiscutata erythropus TaxID=1348616 RepID=A0A9N8Z272_9GLOM|nr:675_t:CDS:2 [Dentiscutata erythropus]
MAFEKISTTIEKSLKRNQIRDVVKISLPANELNKVGVRDAINAKYDAEIIGNNLFIKFDGGESSSNSKFVQSAKTRLVHRN